VERTIHTDAVPADTGTTYPDVGAGRADDGITVAVVVSVLVRTLKRKV